MAIIKYPSKDFKKEAQRALNEGTEFCVIVPKENKKKEIVLEKLEKLYRRKPDGRSKFGRIINTCRIMDFYSTLAPALTETDYDIAFEDRGDLVILFKPKPHRRQPADV